MGSIGTRVEDFLQAPAAAAMFVLADRLGFSAGSLAEPAAVTAPASTALRDLNPWTGEAAANRIRAVALVRPLRDLVSAVVTDRRNAQDRVLFPRHWFATALRQYLTSSEVVGRPGIEPGTYGLKVRRSDAPGALPVQTDHQSARNAQNAQRTGETCVHECFHGRLFLGPLLIAVRSSRVCGRPPGIRPLPRACRHGAGAVLRQVCQLGQQGRSWVSDRQCPAWVRSTAEPGPDGLRGLGCPGDPGVLRIFLSQASLGGARGVGDLDDHSCGVLPR